MIEITHDPGEGSAYIRIATGDMSGAPKQFDGKYGSILVDFDMEGNPVGVEVIA